VRGMKCGAVAAGGGHHVVLLEKEAELGGHLNILKQLPTRAEWHTAIDNLTRAMDVAGVEVRLGVTATQEVIEHEKPDAVICATGASYTTAAPSAYRMERTSIPGHDQHNVLEVGTATRRALKAPKIGRR